MSDILRTNDAEEKNDVLNPQLDDATLRHLYGQMADILLELWKLDFDSISSFSPEESTDRLIDSGPLTLEMNELIRTCGLEDLTSRTPYCSSTDYIASLLELQSTQLEKQRNSVYDSEDCRDKYTCRHLMRAIVLNIVSKRDTHGPFKLFCDDLCLGNVLVDDSLQITSVIDWEFCYSAPQQFAGSIPWWLILQRPPTIINDSGPKAFLDAYLPKAEVFLQALEAREEVKSMDSLEDKLSAQMRQSIQDRSAWFILACRMVSSVDLIHWDMLDEYCWGPKKSIAERVHKSTTTVDIHADRENFVQLKLQQLQEY